MKLEFVKEYLEKLWADYEQKDKVADSTASHIFFFARKSLIQELLEVINEGLET